MVYFKVVWNRCPSTICRAQVDIPGVLLGGISQANFASNQKLTLCLRGLPNIHNCMKWFGLELTRPKEGK